MGKGIWSIIIGIIAVVAVVMVLKYVKKEALA